MKNQDCSDHYVGETARPLATREKEHMTRSDSAIHAHIQETDHSFHTSTILQTEQNNLKRKVKEAIEIKKLNPNLNRDNEYVLAPIFNEILHVANS